jgi:hypothetical protein
MMNRWVALAFGGSMGVLMMFAAGSLKLGDMGMKEHMGWRPPLLSARALSDDRAETMPGRALSDCPSFRMLSIESKWMRTSNVAPDGRIVFVNTYATAVVYFDPASGNFEILGDPEANSEDDFQFLSSVTAPEGKIIMVPYYADVVGILHVAADTADTALETVDISDYFLDYCPDCSKFEGGVLAPNGKVIFAPSMRMVGIFDLASKDLELIDTTEQISQVGDYYAYYMFTDAVTTTDGKVVFSPSDLHAVGIFDPATSTFEAVDINAQISEWSYKWYKFGKATLAPNGKVIFSPLRAEAVGIFCPGSKDLELVDVAGQIPQTFRFYGAALAPNGKVVFAPEEATSVGVFDPATSTFEAIDISAQIMDDGGCPDGCERMFGDAVTAPNGEIIFSPHDFNNVGVFSFPTTTTTSFMLKLKLKVKGGAKAVLKVKVANGHVNATAKVKSGRRRRG